MAREGREVNDPDRWTRRYRNYEQQGRITKVNRAIKKVDEKGLGRVDAPEGPALRAVFRARRSGR